jgi:hypothetical protein
LNTVVASLVARGCLLFALTSVVRAQLPPDLSPQDRAFLERLALARGRAQTLDQVLALPLKSERTVANWVAQDVGADRALRLWCRSLPRRAGTRFYSDASCDVDVCLSSAELRQQLASLLRNHPGLPEAGVSEADLARAEKGWPIVWSTGSAALSERSQTRRPDGWEDVTYEGVQVTRRVAAADACHALFEQAGRLKVTPARQLREFLESDDAVADAVLEGLQKAATVTVECGFDQVAVAEARINLTDLIRILTDVHQQHYRGDAFHAADLRDMALTVGRGELKAAGLAVPPSRYVTKAEYELIELDRPPWADKTLSATGRYEPQDGEEVAEFIRVGIARFDGMDRLRQRILALVIQRDVTVEQFVGYHRELKQDVVTFLGGTRVVGHPKTLPDGGLEVRVELPLRRLWLIVCRAMARIEVAPPSEAESTTQSSPEVSP